MYIEKLRVKNLDNNKDGLATVLLNEKEIAALDNLYIRLSKEKVLTEVEHNLKGNFRILHSLVVLGTLLDSDIVELYESRDVKCVEHEAQ